MARVFFVMPGRAPRSTLFPYTTLFRSGFEEGEPRAGRVPVQVQPGPGTDLEHVAGEPVDEAVPPAVEAGLVQPFVQPVDRKSTRLNSSHMSISYAVFCLKKKIARTVDD